MTSPKAHPWVILGRDGSTTFCETRADWLAQWTYCIRAIEATFRPAARRREDLEHMLRINAAAFRAVVEHGAGDAVLDVTGAIAAADGRLSSGSDHAEVAA